MSNRFDLIYLFQNLLLFIMLLQKVMTGMYSTKHLYCLVSQKKWYLHCLLLVKLIFLAISKIKSLVSNLTLQFTRTAKAPEVYLGHLQTSTVDYFFQRYLKAETVDCFSKSIPFQMSHRVLMHPEYSEQEFTSTLSKGNHILESSVHMR